MEQKSLYSGVKVHLNVSQLFQLLFQLFRSLRWNRHNRWNTLPLLSISKKMLHSIYYSSIPPLPISENHHKECSLKLHNFSNILSRSIAQIVWKSLWEGQHDYKMKVWKFLKFWLSLKLGFKKMNFYPKRLTTQNFRYETSKSPLLKKNYVCPSYLILSKKPHMIKGMPVY